MLSCSSSWTSNHDWSLWWVKAPRTRARTTPRTSPSARLPLKVCSRWRRLSPRLRCLREQVKLNMSNAFTLAPQTSCCNPLPPAALLTSCSLSSLASLHPLPPAIPSPHCATFPPPRVPTSVWINLRKLLGLAALLRWHAWVLEVFVWWYQLSNPLFWIVTSLTFSPLQFCFVDVIIQLDFNSGFIAVYVLLHFRLGDPQRFFLTDEQFLMVLLAFCSEDIEIVAFYFPRKPHWNKVCVSAADKPKMHSCRTGLTPNTYWSTELLICHQHFLYLYHHFDLMCISEGEFMGS